jgi:diguanylate cyclase
VPDPTDWKQKYRDSLREMEEGEKSWRQVEQALRRLVGRLCAAGMGVNTDLDLELQSLAAANRRNAPAGELEILAGTLTTTIVAVDAVAPVGIAVWVDAAPPASSRWESTCAAVLGVLQGLREAGADEPALDQLMEQLSAAATDAALAGVVTGTADLIRAHYEANARERLESASFLTDVTARLGEMTLYLTETGLASRASFDDTASLDSGVMVHVRELSAEVSAATELSALQSLVSARLERVTRQMSEFREREELRRKDQASRTASMHERIADLEREAEELYRTLDREKHGARLDALTRLANRKSFDERIGREIGNLSHGDAPVAMLIWDIDDFKSINDRYGHRAGDRVLQTVANCFVSGLRAEDFVARIGGEEFVVLIPGLTAAAALGIANELRSSVQALRFHFRGTPVRVTVSCGITQLQAGDTPESAFDRADSALYRAKREGKNLCIAA